MANYFCFDLKMKKHALILLVCSDLIFNFCMAQSQQLPSIELNIAMRRITVEVANTDSSRQIGLMNRKNLAPNHGMIFDFFTDVPVCMWMKNTLIPLSVAFIERDGTIINIEEMQPETLTSHCAKKNVRFALEMEARWFSTKKIVPGMKVRGLEKLQ